MAFYLKYRPQNFSDIDVTQTEISSYFKAALRQHATSHAYLFTGGHGIGKTSTARILAKAINCTQTATLSTLFPESSFPVPCNQCEHCLHVSKGNSIDVIEMDAASNRGIDEIRQLKEAIKLVPSFLPKKVYIVDEVHMLSHEAFNALLKTLEEPPSYAVFILCTTELSKVPLTIQSRCTKIQFKKPKVAQIKHYLKVVMEGESLQVDEPALDALARLANGAYRDAVKMLEQLAQRTSVITLDVVNETFSSSRVDVYQQICLCVIKQDLTRVYTIIYSLDEDNVNFHDLIQGFLVYIKNLMFFKHGVLSIEAELSEEAKVIARAFTTLMLSEFLDLLLKASVQQKSTSVPSLPFHLAVTKVMKSAYS